MLSKKNNVKAIVIPVDLDKPRHLCYDFNAFVALEEKFGDVDTALKTLQKTDKDGKATLSLKAMRTFIWAGLVHEEEDLTEMQVGKMLSGIDAISELAQKMNEALASSLPEPEAGKNA